MHVDGFCENQFSHPDEPHRKKRIAVSAALTACKRLFLGDRQWIALYLKLKSSVDQPVVAEWQAAFGLLYRKYLAANLTSANATCLRIAAHQLRTECTLIVAMRHRQVVGTVSLVEDGPGLLSLDRCFGTQLASFRKRRLRLLEATCLAVAPGNDRVISPVFAALTRATFHIARIRNMDRVIAAVHPRHCRFYQRAMGFEQLSEETQYESVEGSIAVCVSGDPTRPALFRQPWQSMFFGNIDPLLLRKSWLSAADVAYFQHLRTSGTTVPWLVNRAA